VTALLKLLVLLAIGGGTAFFGFRVASRDSDEAPMDSASTSGPTLEPVNVEDEAQALEALPELPEVARALFIGGGSLPENTEVSLEQDMLLALDVLPGDVAVHFAGGGSTPSVRELDPEHRPAELLVRLGELFLPRGGRGSRYRPARIATRPATQEEVEASLGRYLSQGSTLLTLFVAAHGERDDDPRESFIALWGEGELTVGRLTEVHDESARPLRVVSGTCFSGGFGEIVFAGADAARGPAKVLRCGLFASTEDREASGCDPNPNRRAQESYLIHLLQALGGRDRDGRPLPLSELDLDGDGQVGLLEAHTRARTHAESIDVPTTTSERLLRSLVRDGGPPARALLPEDAKVVDVLSRALELPTEASARARLRALEAELDVLDERLEAAEVELERAHGKLRVSLLSRWPTLNDPYHPLFARTLERDHGAIAQSIDAWRREARLETIQQGLDVLEVEYNRHLTAEARVLRLVRAHENLALAGGLPRLSGSARAAYSKVLDCERAPP
jgi:hypothetical protein